MIESSQFRNCEFVAERFCCTIKIIARAISLFLSVGVKGILVAAGTYTICARRYWVVRQGGKIPLGWTRLGNADLMRFHHHTSLVVFFFAGGRIYCCMFCCCSHPALESR